jgi:hypothetical protein
MTGQQDSKPPWGSEPAEDLIEQGRDRGGTGWPGRARWGARWSPWWPPRLGRTAKVTAGLVTAALAVGLAGGYLGGYQAGDAHGRSQVPKPRPTPAHEVSSFGLAETGSQCSTALGKSLEVGVEVVNGSPGPIRLGALTARFPRGGLTVTGAVWGPCGTLPYRQAANGDVLPVGASTWLSVTATTAAACPDGLPVEYVASFSQFGQTYTVDLPGYVEMGIARAKGCPTT